MMNDNADKKEKGLDDFLQIHVDNAIENHLSTHLTFSTASIVAHPHPHPHASANAAAAAAAAAAADADADADTKFIGQDTSVSASLDSNSIDDTGTTREFQNILQSSGHRMLMEDLCRYPLPKILKQKNKVKAAASTSFSLLDMFSSSGGMGMGISLSAPPYNIRDILECQDSDAVLQRCMEAGVRVQDLILGFNTTQQEVFKLANLLHGALVASSSSSNKNNLSMALSLHETWMEECVKEAPDCTSFAFLLLRNVILASCHDISNANLSWTIRERMEIVKTLQKLLRFLMKVWTDAASFQISWMEIIYLLIKATFVFQDKNDDKERMIGCNHVHAAWVYHDPRGKLFATCLACMDSTLHVQLLMKKTKLVPYLMDTLANGPRLQLDDTDKIFFGTDGLDLPVMFMTHALSILKIIIEHCPSYWELMDEIGDTNQMGESSSSLPPSLSSQSSYELPTMDNHSQLCHWVQCLDDELKLLTASESQLGVDDCNEDQNMPTIETMGNWMRPFSTLLDIIILANKAQHDEEREMDGSLRVMCEEAITHIIRTCAWTRDVNLLTAIMSNVFELIQHMHRSNGTVQRISDEKSVTKCDHQSLSSPPPVAVTMGLIDICRNVFADVPWRDLRGANEQIWSSGISSLMDLILKLMTQVGDGEMMYPNSNTQEEDDVNLRMEGLNRMMGMFVPLLRDSHAMKIVGKERIRQMFVGFSSTMLKSPSTSFSDLAPCLAILSSSSHGIILMTEVLHDISAQSMGMETHQNSDLICPTLHRLSILSAVSSIFNVLLAGAEYVEIYQGKTLDAWMILRNLCSFDEGCDAILCSDHLARLCNFLEFHSKSSSENNDDDGEYHYEIELAAKTISILVSSDVFAAAFRRHKSSAFVVIEALVTSLSETKNARLVTNLLQVLQHLFDNRDALTALMREEGGSKFHDDLARILHNYGRGHVDIHLRQRINIQKMVDSLRVSLPQAPHS